MPAGWRRSRPWNTTATKPTATRRRSNPIGIILSSQQLFEVEKVSDKVLFLKNGKPTHLSDVNSEDENLCYMELDTDCPREMLNKALENISIRKIDYNGGMYLLTIENNVGFNEVLSALIQNNVEIKYVRNISQSTKRLFI